VFGNVGTEKSGAWESSKRKNTIFTTWRILVIGTNFLITKNSNFAVIKFLCFDFKENIIILEQYKFSSNNKYKT